MPLRPPNEDLFENTRMTFGEHLEELRKVLLRALYGLAIGVAIGMFFADRVVLWLKTPLTRAIANFTVTQAEDQLRKSNEGVVPLEFRTLLDQRVMAPRRVLIDPEQLTRAMQPGSNSDQAVSAQPEARFQRRNLSTANVRAVCQRLAADGEATREPSLEAVDDTMKVQRRAIWDALSPEEQVWVANWAAADSIPDADVARFVEMLNRLSVNAELFLTPAFASRFQPTSSDHLFSASEAEALRELKNRIDVGGVGVATLKCQLNQWLIWSALAPDLPRPDVPFVAVDIWESAEVNAQSLAATEAFMIWMKAGLILGLVIASPWVFYQLWTFVAAGLYPHEQKYVYYYLPISLGLFFAGAALAFFFVFDPVLRFLFQFNASMGIDPQPRIGEWMTFVLVLPLGFGIAFQLPIVMLFLNLVGIFTVANYLEKWRVAVLVIFIVSMVLTPAEPISMILMAIPLTFLYFLGIGMCVWLRPNRNPYRRVYEP